MTADAFGPSCLLDPSPKALLPLAELFQRFGPRVPHDRVNGLALQFLRSAASIGEELAGRETPGRIGQAARREAKWALRLPDDALLAYVGIAPEGADSSRYASADLRSEIAVRLDRQAGRVTEFRAALEQSPSGMNRNSSPLPVRL